ncbi:MAG: hypothetical protein DRJ08_01760 [Acidobacteria bacterium]|nr:MAG: hypothetical protein DRJ08_01760 [Acidobacteriota bacterium]
MNTEKWNTFLYLKGRTGISGNMVALFTIAFSLIAMPAFAQFHLADPGYIHNHKANELFDSGKYKAALQEYIQALSLRDNSPQVKYNMGNAFVKSGRVEDAVKTYKDLLSKAPKELQPRLYYNTGNALYQAKKYKDAAEFYRKALLADPGDRWAKENYEMSLKKMKLQKQKQKKQQDNKKKDDKKKSQKQNKADAQKKNDQKKQQKQPPSEQQQKKERARRMLKALREQEKQDRKKNAKRKTARPVERNVKDW